ncbi:unnamed protein product [Hymenolepis diminuta]|uniref:EGF-like domain-containing protein n=1 Tax=Hymenolepis diminuta TaxID=6216 RepID=A0A564ZAV4_HYMDI|nr:unnamed protein product [Hymenolepis diminuta]
MFNFKFHNNVARPADRRRPSTHLRQFTTESFDETCAKCNRTSRCVPYKRVLRTLAGVMIARDAGLLMEHQLPASSLNQQLLNCIYRVRQCIPACLNGGRLSRPWMPWKKCHCECPPGFRGFVCQIFQPAVK